MVSPQFVAKHSLKEACSQNSQMMSKQECASTTNVKAHWHECTNASAPAKNRFPIRPLWFPEQPKCSPLFCYRGPRSRLRGFDHADVPHHFCLIGQLTQMLLQRSWQSTGPCLERLRLHCTRLPRELLQDWSKFLSQCVQPQMRCPKTGNPMKNRLVYHLTIG